MEAKLVRTFLAAMAVMAWGPGVPPPSVSAQEAALQESPSPPLVVENAADPGDDGDAEHGKIVFYRCKACHRLDAGPALEGPNLDHLFGRMAGSAPDYDGYSAALRDAGFVWTATRLDAWLEDPNGFLPGNRMRFAGLRRAQDRRDLIAFLREATRSRK